MLRLANAWYEVEFLRRACVACLDTLDVVAQVDDIASFASLLGGDYLRAFAAHLRNAATSDAATSWLTDVVDPMVERMEFLSCVENFTSVGAPAWEDATRAQETLTLTRARSYNGYPKAPSRFLSEIGLDPEGGLAALPAR